MIPFITRNILLSLLFLFALNEPVKAQVDFNSSNLPIIIIETAGQEIADEPKISAILKIIDNEEGENFINDTNYAHVGEIGIEIRGSTSQSFDKKQYGFETVNMSVNDNVSLLGLPEENDWILSASYTDKSLIRNILSYNLFEKLGHYAPRTKLCELIVNEEYLGVYILTEKIKRDKNRVDIAKLKPDEIFGDDITGGYILKIDKFTGNSGPSWYSDMGGVIFQYEYPDHNDIVPEQKVYIKSYIDSFEHALSSNSFMNLETGYMNYIDENSFIDFFIINELSKNVDGYFLSTFLYKDKNSNDGKLTIGPIWDFDLTFGNAEYREGGLSEGLQLDINPVPWWWDRLLQDSLFVDKVEERWCNIRNGFLAYDSLVSTIDSLVSIIDEPQKRNFKKWDILGNYIWPNYYTSNTYAGEIDYLKAWSLDRLNWLDKKFNCPNLDTQGNNEINIYPNPFHDNLFYDFSINRSGNVSVILYDVNGKEVARMIDNSYSSKWAKYSIDWDSTQMQNSIYYIVMKIDGEIVSRKKVVKL